jgi:hypothetical protein
MEVFPLVACEGECGFGALAVVERGEEFRGGGGFDRSLGNILGGKGKSEKQAEQEFFHRTDNQSGTQLARKGGRAGDKG